MRIWEARRRPTRKVDATGITKEFSKVLQRAERAGNSGAFVRAGVLPCFFSTRDGLAEGQARRSAE